MSNSSLGQCVAWDAPSPANCAPDSAHALNKCCCEASPRRCVTQTVYTDAFYFVFVSPPPGGSRGGCGLPFSYRNRFFLVGWVTDSRAEGFGDFSGSARRPLSSDWDEGAGEKTCGPRRVFAAQLGSAEFKTTAISGWLAVWVGHHGVELWLEHGEDLEHQSRTFGIGGRNAMGV